MKVEASRVLFYAQVQKAAWLKLINLPGRLLLAVYRHLLYINNRGTHYLYIK